MFPDPESPLYITGATQAEFVQWLNALILEFLFGIELHPDSLRRAQTREDLLGSLRYRKTNGDLSARPPTRVELLTEILFPWSSISYGGCRFLRVARAETVGKFRAIYNYYVKYSAENLAESILNVDISQDQEDYVLFNLTMEQYRFQPQAPCTAVPLHCWTDQPDHTVPIPNLQSNSTLQDWLDWTAMNNRRVRPAVMEWIQMDPSRATKFIENIDRSPTFRKKFGGLYVPVVAALERLGGSDRGAPAFIEEKLIRSGRP